MGVGGWTGELLPSLSPFLPLPQVIQVLTPFNALSAATGQATRRHSLHPERRFSRLFRPPEPLSKPQLFSPSSGGAPCCVASALHPSPQSAGSASPQCNRARLVPGGGVRGSRTSTVDGGAGRGTWRQLWGGYAAAAHWLPILAAYVGHGVPRSDWGSGGQRAGRGEALQICVHSVRAGRRTGAGVWTGSGSSWQRHVPDVGGRTPARGTLAGGSTVAGLRISFVVIFFSKIYCCY